MSLSVRSLASGSTANSVLIRSPQSIIAIDIGLSSTRFLELLAQEQISTSQLNAICLTHEHGDHIRGAVIIAEQLQIPLVCNAATFAALRLPHLPWIDLPTGGSLQLGDCLITSFAVSHDAADPVGYRLEHPQGCVALATDLGEWTPELCRQLAPADLLIIEANHQPDRLRWCGYSRVLQQRILGQRGHLANEQTAALLLALHHLDPRARTVWLAHLSQRSNTPALALTSVLSALETAAVRSMQVSVAPRSQPGPHWRYQPATQLAFWDEAG
ncbi:MAG: MBL fold metallo-hydrolase [Herpetosiphonaceae bacterium]|nr:MBL fold metallo-hydrolase [Herpetosiphonaceae bacterium]